MLARGRVLQRCGVHRSVPRGVLHVPGGLRCEVEARLPSDAPLNNSIHRASDVRYRLCEGGPADHADRVGWDLGLQREGWKKGV